MPLDRVDRSIIERELRRIGGAIEAPTTFVLFGGCCMSAHGIKDSTKDTDAVVYHDRGLYELTQDLQRARYHVVDGYVVPGQAFDTYVVVENDDGLSLELFPPGRLFGGLAFSDHMRSDTTHWFTEGHLRVDLADPSTVFLLKSVTGRWRRDPTRDIEDLQSILDRGLLDPAWVEDEWRRQIEGGLDGDAVELAIEAISILEEEGYTVRWAP